MSTADDNSSDPEWGSIRLATAKAELALKEAELRRKNWDHAHPTSALGANTRSPVFLAAVVAGLVTIVGSLLTFLNAYSQQETDRLKSEQQAIFDAISTGDSTQATRNLEFLVEVGLVHNEKLKKYLEDHRSYVPSTTQPVVKVTP